MSDLPVEDPRALALVEMGMGKDGAGPEAFHLLRGGKAALQPGDRFDEVEKERLTKKWRSLDDEFEQEPQPRRSLAPAERKLLLHARSNDEAIEALWSKTDRAPHPTEAAALGSFVEVAGRRLVAGVRGHSNGALSEDGPALASAWETTKLKAAYDRGILDGPGLKDVKADLRDLFEDPEKLDAGKLHRLSGFVTKFATATGFVQNPELAWDPDVKLAAIDWDGENAAPVFAWSRPEGKRAEVDSKDIYRWGVENLRRVFERATPDERMAEGGGDVGPVFAADAQVGVDRSVVSDAVAEVAAKLGVEPENLVSTVSAVWARLKAEGSTEDVVGDSRAVIEDGSTAMGPPALLRRLAVPPTEQAIEATKKAGGVFGVRANPDGSVSIVGDNVDRIKDELRAASPYDVEGGATVWLLGHSEPGEVVPLEGALAEMKGQHYRAFLHHGQPMDAPFEPGNRVVIRGLSAGDEELVYGQLRREGLDTSGGQVSPVGYHYEIVPGEEDEPATRKPTRGLVVDLPDDVTKPEVERVLGMLANVEKTDVALYLHGTRAAPKGYAKVWEEHWDSARGERFTYRSAAGVDPRKPNTTPVWVAAEEAVALTTVPWKPPTS